MTPRPLIITTFLERHGWHDAAIAPLEADFSPRRYARLTKTDGTTALLMDANTDQKTPEFVGVAQALNTIGLSAPQIIAEQSAQGLVLMEDFGNHNAGTALDNGKIGALHLAKGMTEVLAYLHQSEIKTVASNLNLPTYNADLFSEQVMLFTECYLPFVTGKDSDKDGVAEFHALWHSILKPLDDFPQSLLLRDYMPDNIMLLHDRKGVKDFGLLDFQDAGWGPMAYDIASTAEEVRRGGGLDLLPTIIEHYLAHTPHEMRQHDWLGACRILWAQRHMRIMGIVVRMAVQKGRRDKLNYLPRLEHGIRQIVGEKRLDPLASWLKTHAAHLVTY